MGWVTVGGLTLFGVLSARFPRYAIASFVTLALCCPPLFLSRALHLSYAVHTTSIPSVSALVWFVVGAVAGVSNATNQGKLKFHNSPLMRRTALGYVCSLFTLGVGLGLGGSFGSLSSLIETLIFPSLVVILFIRLVQRDQRCLRFGVWAFVVCCAISSVLASFQLVTQSALVAAPMARDNVWYTDAISLGHEIRGFGFMDHPISFGLSCSVAIALTTILQVTPRVVIPLELLLLSGCVVSGSRIAMTAGFFAIVFSFFRFRQARIVAIAAIFLGSTILLTSALSSILFQRLGSDGNSSSLRQVAYTQGLAKLSNHLLGGLGGNQSGLYSRQSLGLPVSFESAPLIWALDYGVLATLILMTVWIRLLLAHLPSVVSGIRIAGSLMLLGNFFYSGVAAMGQAPVINAVVLALVAAAHIGDGRPLRSKIDEGETGKTGAHNLVKPASARLPRDILDVGRLRPTL